MTKFYKLPIYKQAIRVYVLSFFISLLLSPLFGRFYIMIFNPRLTGGLFPSPKDPLALFDGTLFAFFFFLPLFTFWLIAEKQRLTWFVGAVFPLLIVLLGGGSKDVLWALILSAIGWLLAQGILLIRSKVKK